MRRIIELSHQTDDVVMIDCHSPYKWGGQNDHVFLVRPDHREGALKVAQLGRELRMLCAQADPAHCLIYDGLLDKRTFIDWDYKFVSDETVARLRAQPLTTSNGYMAQHGAKLAVSVETTYFGTPDNRVTQRSMRAWGERLAHAIELYIVGLED